MSGPSKRVTVLFNIDAGTPTSFNIYQADSQAGLDTSATASPAASVAGSERAAVFFANAAFSTAYLAVVAEFSDGTRTAQSNVTSADLSNGRVLKLTNRNLSHNYGEKNPLTELYVTDARAMAPDAWGNVWYTGAYGSLAVICYDVVSVSPFCNGKSPGKSYLVIGEKYDGEYDGDSGADMSQSGIGRILGMNIDNWGNVYFADYTFRKIRVVCFDNNAVGYCSGKTEKRLYTITGTGTAADATNDSLASTSAVGSPRDVNVDSLGNLYITDATYGRILSVCYDIGTSAGFCQGKTPGNIYYVAGDGTTAVDGADNSTASSTGLGTTRALALSGNNIFFLDRTYNRLRAICFDITSAGFCNGKTIGNHYRIIGGTNTDGADAAAIPAVTTAFGLGNPEGIALDSSGNIFIADANYGRVRAICLNTSGGFCAGKSVNTHYRYVGTGTVSNGGTNVSVTTGIGATYYLKFDTNTNLYISDTTYAKIRVVCNVDDKGCTGLQAGNLHTLANSITIPTAPSGSLAHENTSRLNKSMAVDSANNYYFWDHDAKIYKVICNEVTANTFCKNRTLGAYYEVAGSGTVGVELPSAADLATNISLKDVRDSTIDQDDNILLGDYSWASVRIVCVNLVNRCAGKIVGYMYSYSGSGDTISPEGANDNVVATTALLATSLQGTGGVVLDSLKNVFHLNYDNPRRLWVKCADVTSAGFCQGKTAGNIYRYAGGGTAFTDGIDRMALNLGRSLSLAVDAFDNFYFSNNGTGPGTGVYMICRSTGTPEGFCTGKTAGAIYRFTGTGVSGNGVSGPAATVQHSNVEGMKFDSLGNFILQDSSGYLRIVCSDIVSAGFCQGKTPGDIYRYMGNGMLGNVSSVQTDPAKYGLDVRSNSVTIDRLGNILIGSGHRGEIRVIIP